MFCAMRTALAYPMDRRVQGTTLLPLEITGLRLRLGGRAVLNGLDLRSSEPGCTVIMGSNGAGKSQLLRLIHGLERPHGGQITWNGKPAHQVTDRQAMVFQKPALLRRSVAANLDFVLRTRGRDRSQVDELLSHVGLLDKAHQAARRLSGGEAQRLAMARALALGPQALLLDEPTASLDPAHVLVIETVINAAREAGVKVLLVTHDIGQARRLADEVVFLYRGRVAEQATANDFFERPMSNAGRDFLAGRITL